MIVIVIPAKNKSRRLPKKNMTKVFGKPLIYFTIDYARKSKIAEKIIVSSESNEILNYSKKNNLETVKRPTSLCGETPIIDVYKHVYKKLKKKYKIKTLVGLQPDHPDRKLSLDKVIKIFFKKKLDFLYSKDKFGDKNGAHYILSKKVLDGRKNFKKSYVIDNCTNVHLKKDLKLVKKNLRRKKL
tara:strand:+ start:3285 stop:3839 length:555 start_codon:yes stop_codon:yes gene_type:complete